MSEAERFRIREVLRIPEIRAAMLGTFVIMLGYGILSPVLPNYARSFGVGYGAVGLLISSFSLARPITMTRARRTEPTPCGGGVTHHSSTRAGYHRPVSVTSVRTANTSSIDRSIVIS